VKKKRGDAATRRVGNKNTARRVSVSERSTVPLITLLTDFGAEDYFVGAVKGVILSENPAARIVDITHEIPPHDVEAAAFTLLAVHTSFPAGTIHVAVVDPGVGSARKALVMESSKQFFIGPDNGIFSYAAADDAAVFELTNTAYFRAEVSQTFHGRDVFAPVAAALSNGMAAKTLGQRTSQWVRLPPLHPKALSDGKLEARIIHIDRFGNCVTSITRDEVGEKEIASGPRLMVGKKLVDSFKRFYGEEPRGRSKAFAIWGSAGFLEIAAENRSAADLLKVKRGDKVIVYRKAV
jgi:S-adenosylmethionine hydrolase